MKEYYDNDKETKEFIVTYLNRLNDGNEYKYDIIVDYLTKDITIKDFTDVNDVITYHFTYNHICNVSRELKINSIYE